MIERRRAALAPDGALRLRQLALTNVDMPFHVCLAHS